MLEVPVYNEMGEQIDKISIDEAIFGSIVRRRLLKLAVDMYLANRRQGTVATKSRGQVEGSTRKLYRQKGTGRARAGSIRSPIRRGGGHTFAKQPKDWSKEMPKKERRLARDSAVLSKIRDGELLVIDRLSLERPKTKYIAGVIKALKIEGKSCLIGIADYNRELYLSARNIPRVDIMPVGDFNAYEILAHKYLLITREGFDRLVSMATGRSRELVS